MPKKAVRVVQANGKGITLETTVGTDYRFSIPKNIRCLLKPNTKVTITIIEAKGGKTNG